MLRSSPSLCSALLRSSPLECFVLYLPPSSPSSLHPLLTAFNFPGALKALVTAYSPQVRSLPVSPSPLPSAPFGSTLASSYAVPRPIFGASVPSVGAPLFQLPAGSMGGSLVMPEAAPPCLGAGMVQSVYKGGAPPMGLNMNPPCAGVGMAQSGFLGGNTQAAPLLLGMGMVQPSFTADNLQAGAVHLGGSFPQAGGAVLSGSGLSETTNQNSNPFLF